MGGGFGHPFIGHDDPKAITRNRHHRLCHLDARLHRASYGCLARGARRIRQHGMARLHLSAGYSRVRRRDWVCDTLPAATPAKLNH